MGRLEFENSRGVKANNDFLLCMQIPPRKRAASYRFVINWCVVLVIYLVNLWHYWLSMYSTFVK